MYIFNNLQVSNNIPSERCKNAYLNFTINNGTMSTVEILLKYLKNLEEQYPHIVKNVSYHGIRHGGSALQQAKSSPYMFELSHGIEQDLKDCIQKIFETCVYQET